MNHLPNQPPAPAHDYPHNPTYQSAQLKPNPPHQPMPYNLLATLSKKNTTDSEWMDWNQTDNEKSEILRALQYDQTNH